MAEKGWDKDSIGRVSREIASEMNQERHRQEAIEAANKREQEAKKTARRAKYKQTSDDGILKFIWKELMR